MELDSLIEPLAYQNISDTFCDELTKSAKGRKTSLPFIHNRLPNKPLVSPEEVFQVFVIGGTNGESATVKCLEDGSVKIVSHKIHPELTKFKTVEHFLTFIDNHIDKNTKAVGISFAAELIPVVGIDGQLDGILNEGETKGHGFHGLQQEQVGSTIEHHFKKTHNRDLIVSVGNDTVCLIASIASREVKSNKLVAGIVGTGYNMAFFLDDQTIINVQAGNFNNFKASTTGKLVDQQSTNPSQQLYDKEVSKLFSHYNVLIEEQQLKGGSLKSGEELAHLALTNRMKEGDIARALFKRSASLVAAQFSGFYNFKGRPTKLTAIMQGSLFWKGPNYKEMVTDELIKLGVPMGDIVFENLEYADILGAAKLITSGS